MQLRTGLGWMLAALALLASGEVRAAEFNKASDVWNSAANWTPNGLPTTATNCVIGSATLADAAASIGTGDACSSAYLYLGNGAGRRGTLNMSDGTLTMAGALNPGNGTSSTGIINQTGGTIANFNNVNVGNGSSSYGAWTLSGSSMATGMTSGSLYVPAGVGATGKIVVAGSAMWSNAPNTYIRIGYGGAGSDGTVDVQGGAFWANNGNSSWQVGASSGAVGRLVVSGGTLNIASGQGALLGAVASGAGIVSVSGDTCVAPVLTVGYLGKGEVYVTNSGALTARLLMGYTAGSNAYMLVDGSATVTANGIVGPQPTLVLGNWAGNVSVLDLKGGTTTVTCGNGTPHITIGNVAGSTGLVTVAGGSHTWSNGSGSSQSIGNGAGALGRITIQGGSLKTTGVGGWILGNSGRGELLLSGGAYTNNMPFYLGYASGGHGLVQVTGGDWVQSGALNVGNNAAGVTGIVTVVNSVQTNITGAMTVGGGTVGDRYGAVTVSNATFGGGTAVTVWTNGFVELTGTGSVLRCSMFTCRGGSLTNRVRKLAGGLEVTNAASTSLVVTNGGRIHLAFEEDPVVAGDFWGLRWAGNTHKAALQALADAGSLTWDVSALPLSYQGVGIYTNATDTFVGVYVAKIAPKGMVLMVQ